MDIELFARALGALFAIMNPFVALPIFLSLTSQADGASARKMALMATASAAVMCAVVAIAGTSILDFFGITIHDFRVAGGLVLLLIGLSMLNGTETTAHKQAIDPAQAAPDPSIAFYPMAFPMIVGPGTIATILIFVAQAGTAEETVAVGAAIVCVLLSVGVVLFFSPVIGHYMSQTLRVITTRLMGMILVAIAVAMITTGLKTLFPGLA